MIESTRFCCTTLSKPFGVKVQHALIVRQKVQIFEILLHDKSPAPLGLAIIDQHASLLWLDLQVFFV